MPKRQGFAALLLSLVFFTFGCSTGTVSDTSNYPITSVFSAVEKALSMGIQGYSQNHREFYSRPFLVKPDEDAVKQGLHERGVAKVTVLGDMRPYTVEVHVTIQRARIKGDKNKLTNDDYYDDRSDERLARKLLNSIQNILDRREKDKNIIDDFRPF